MRKCPDCGAQAMEKLISNTHFRLKGTGWYATDFRDGNQKKQASEQAQPASDQTASGDNQTVASDSASSQQDSSTASKQSSDTGASSDSSS